MQSPCFGIVGQSSLRCIYFNKNELSHKQLKKCRMAPVKTIYSLFEDSELKFNLCCKKAIIYYDVNGPTTLMYEELTTSINKVATTLSSLSTSEEIIGIFSKPVLHLPALLLGIMKVESAFTFLRTDDPSECLKNLMRFIKVKTLIIEQKLKKVVKFHLCECWKHEDSIVFHQNETFMIYKKSRDDCCKVNCNNSVVNDVSSYRSELAYIAQTSGTTGHPKVVQVPHDCIVPNIIHLSALYGVTSSDCIFMAAPLTFDPSIIDIFMALTNGACLVMTHKFIKLIPKRLSQILVDCNITILQATPSLLQTLDKKFLRESLLCEDTKLRILALGGERCPSLTKLQSLKANDNKTTRFFNLYGVTEVSCWATYHEVDFSRGNNVTGYEDIPLGKPLLDTNICVVDELDVEIEEGFGQLLISGLKRRCIIDNESWEEEEKHVRRTGDWVYKSKNGEIFFESRKDSMVKVHGRKINVRAMEKSVEKLLFVDRVVVTFHPEKLQFYIFVVLNPAYAENQDEIKRTILKTVREAQAETPVLQIIFVANVPITSHGKVDYRNLLRFTEKYERTYTHQTHNWTIDSIADHLTLIWKTLLGNTTIKEDDNYIFSGGNSLSALQMVLEIENMMNIKCPNLLDIVLNHAFKDIKQLLASELLVISDEEPRPKVPKLARLTPSYDAKEEHSEECLVQNKNICHQEANRHSIRAICYCSNCTFVPYATHLGRTPVLKKHYFYNLKKCIDASPCFMKFELLDLTVCYIGSHSGLFCCVDVQKCSILWEVMLPDRIESSACVSGCGQYVLVGCHDCCLYCFDSMTGALVWSLKTGSMVKSSPAVSDKNAFVGSHDHYLYAVNIKNGQIKWKMKVGEGSIFSSPAVSCNQVCAATLDGVIAVLDADSGTYLWRHEYGKPFFSSPVFTASFCVLIGCVDGNLLHFDDNGNLVRKYATGGAIFSSPTLCSETSVLIGSQDAKVYRFLLSGKHLWSFQCNSAIYSKPFVIRVPNSLDYVMVCETDGMIYVLNAENGKVLTTFECPDKLFSSPVVLDNYLAVGCRDNNLYIFKICDS